MTIPNFPIDNLYKFSALVGTIIIIGSLYIPYILRSEVDKQILLVNLKMKTSRLEIEYTNQKIDDIRRIIDNSIEIQKGEYKRDLNKLELSYSEKELKDLVNESTELSKKDMVGFAELDYYSSELDYYSSELDRLFTEAKLVTYLSFVSIAIGVFLSVFGYRRWYYKIQRYQDKALQDSITLKKETQPL